jgi:hypothetical protein
MRAPDIKPAQKAMPRPPAGRDPIPLGSSLGLYITHKPLPFSLHRSTAMATPSSRAGATRCAATVLPASLLLLAAVAGGGVAGEAADRDAARGGVGGPMDCFTTCSTQLVGYIMTTIQCFNKCAAGGGGGGGGGAAVAEASSVCDAKGDRLAIERLLREVACGCDRGEPQKCRTKPDEE